MTTKNESARKIDESDQAMGEMFQANGQAISDWGLVEEGLFKIFFQLIGSAAIGPPSCIFIAAENVRTKIQMVDSMMRHSKGGRKVLKEWESLLKRCDKLRASRNALVHRRVVMLELGNAKAQAALIAYSHDLRDHLKEEYAMPPHIKIGRVKELSTEFRQLGADLSQFANGIQHSEA
jgi:hypothetical protein